MSLFKTILQYRNFNDMRKHIVENAPGLPQHIALVVGIPRSGMVPAYMLGLLLNKPVLDLASYQRGEQPTKGFREVAESSGDQELVLIVDDSISSGKQLAKTKSELAELFPHTPHLYLTVFASPESKHLVDVYFEEVSLPRAFEWNLLHSWVYEYSCVDIDGVLCEDPSEDQNDDGDAYREFLANAIPRFLPKCKVHSLVTSRLEKYRPETEAWLHKHGIEFNRLVMMDLPDKAARVKSGGHGKHKANAYAADDKAILFIESSRYQAEEIFRITGKPVFSVEGFHFYPHRDAPAIAPVTIYNPGAKKKKPLVYRIRRKIEKTLLGK